MKPPFRIRTQGMAAVIDAQEVRYVTLTLTEALSDISSAIRLCEQTLYVACDDAGITDKTATSVRRTASMLAVAGRLLDFPIDENELLGMKAEQAMKEHGA